MNQQLTKIEVYSDGSGNTIDGDGGAGFVVVEDGVEIYSNGFFLHKATNNMAELSAAIAGLGWVRHRYCIQFNYRESELDVTLVSDSQLVLNYAKGTWRCKQDHLKSYRDKLQAEYTFFSNRDTKWVKGHSGHPQNEKCDLLARTARYYGRNVELAGKFVRTLIRFKLTDGKSDEWILDLADKLKLDRDNAILAARQQ